jgi:hypothetical protein
MEDVEYCREIESYLCRKNGGHLVRIVGPAFQTVCQWSDQGIPLKIVFRGIDRCVDRSNARGGRKRPLRIEFCEADVLTVFDDWRRALGVTASQVSEAGEAFDEEAASPKGSLPAHFSRSVARLLAARSEPPDAAYDETIAQTIRELDALAETAKTVRGEARNRLIERLAELDVRVMAAARHRVDAPTAEALQREADAELAAFSGRMPTEARERARQLAFERLLRESLNLPVLTYD